MSEMKPGLLGKAQIDVSEDNTARAAGSGTLMVFLKANWRNIMIFLRMQIVLAA